MVRVVHKRGENYMRKYCIVAMLVGSMLLMAGFVLAGERETNNSEGKTVFTNIAIVGNDVSGVPGYIEMMSNATTAKRFYLYVDSTHHLRMASDPAVGYGASPTCTVAWADASGVVIGP